MANVSARINNAFAIISKFKTWKYHFEINLLTYLGDLKNKFFIVVVFFFEIEYIIMAIVCS